MCNAISSSNDELLFGFLRKTLKFPEESKSLFDIGHESRIIIALSTARPKLLSQRAHVPPAGKSPLYRDSLWSQINQREIGVLFSLNLKCFFSIVVIFDFIKISVIWTAICKPGQSNQNIQIMFTLISMCIST